MPTISRIRSVSGTALPWMLCLPHPAALSGHSPSPPILLSAPPPHQPPRAGSPELQCILPRPHPPERLPSGGSSHKGCLRGQECWGRGRGRHQVRGAGNLTSFLPLNWPRKQKVILLISSPLFSSKFQPPQQIISAGKHNFFIVIN